MAYDLDYESDIHCPVFGRVIDSDLCYESLMALSRAVKVSSVPELVEYRTLKKPGRFARSVRIASCSIFIATPQ